MFNKKTQSTTSTEPGFIPYCDQIIIAMLLVIIIAVPLYFDIHLHSVFDLSKITILYVLTFAMLAIWSIKTIINCQQVRPEPTVNGQDIQIQQHLRPPLILPILAFLFISGFATAFSINPYLSLVGTYKRYGGFISTIVYISLFFIIIHFIDKKRLRSLLNVIIFTACFASIYGILQHFGLDLYHWSTSFGYGIRVSATFGHPAFFSAFLIMVIPLVLIKIFSDPSEQNCQASSNFRYSTFLYLGILTLLIVAFYYTKTRASFLGLLISNIFFFSLIGKKNLVANKTKTIVTATIIIGLSIFFNVSDRTSVIGRFIDDVEPAILDSKEPSHFLEDSYEEAGIASKLEGTMLMRIFQYTTGLKIIHDYPILGIGPDTLGMIYPQYLATVYKEKGEHKHFENQNRIHNDFLDIAVSRGLLGLGVYLWFIFAYARMVWKGCKRANSSNKVLIIGLCASCLAYFIQNQFSFGHVPILTLFWFLVAMSVIASPVINSLPDGLENSVKHKPELIRWIGALTIRKGVKQTFCIIIGCLMFSLIILCLFRYKANIYFEHGRRALNKSEIKEAIHSYETAVKYNPLSLNYNNVLNGIYLKMAETGSNKDSKKITEGLPNLFSREQTTMWFVKAIDGAEKVQKFYPRDYHSAFTLGQAYHILDKISPSRLSEGNEDMSKEAFKNYRIATTLHPFKFEYRNKLARFYAEKGQYEEAIHELKEAKSISPSNQAAYLNLAKVFMNDRERYEEAEAVLLEFIKRNPDNEITDIYRLLSSIYTRTTKWEKALGQSLKIIQINREDLEAHKYASMANFKLERYDDAQRLCDRILNLTGEGNNAYNKYAKEMLELLSEK
jgi:tetratricopeptide (TPR) repeat protein/O-antigen ligase